MNAHRGWILMAAALVGCLVAGGSWAGTPAGRAQVQSASTTTTVPNAGPGLPMGSPLPPEPPPPEDIAPSIDITFKNSHLPMYPMSAVKQHHQGLVILDVTIDAKSSVLDVRVERSSGWPELDKAAVDAAYGWRYRAGIFNDKPAGGVVRVPVNFRF